MPLSREIQQHTQTNATDDMKKRILELMRAYHKSYAIYSELLQNAVDAIHRRFYLFKRRRPF